MRNTGLALAEGHRKQDSRADSEIALLASLGLDAKSTVVDLGTVIGQFALAAAPNAPERWPSTSRP